ncbi:MAG: hypothetical protein JSS65_08165 [Armatimonadetes bacterium]|nr:hypothetical protein [Armatimonadota bacterium]
MSRKVLLMCAALVALAILAGCEQTPPGRYNPPPKPGEPAKQGGPAQGSIEP